MASERDSWDYRVAREADELKLKIDRLSAFLSGPHACKVTAGHRDLLCEQRAFMRGYLDTLERRLLDA